MVFPLRANLVLAYSNRMVLKNPRLLEDPWRRGSVELDKSVSSGLSGERVSFDRDIFDGAESVHEFIQSGLISAG